MARIYQCPDNCNEGLSAQAVQHHNWEVDEYGNFLNDFGCYYSDVKEITCASCGKEAVSTEKEN